MAGSNLRLRSEQKFNPIIAGIIALVLVVAGFIIVQTRAAGPFAVIRPESSSVGPGATVVNDSTAVGGQAIQFGTITPGDPTAGYSSWSNPATWGGRVPAAGEVITIPAGKKIELDID